MSNWNRLLMVLNQTQGFPNKIRMIVKKKAQVFDQRTDEHVFILEYRIKVNPGTQPPSEPMRRTAASKPNGPIVIAVSIVDADISQENVPSAFTSLETRGHRRRPNGSSGCGESNHCTGTWPHPGGTLSTGHNVVGPRLTFRGD